MLYEVITYRYFDGDVQYPFAYGLSYVDFDYSWTQAPAKKYKTSDKISISVNVKNTGEMDAKEVVPVFISYPNLDRMPVKELKQFTKKQIAAGGSQIINFEIPVWDLAKWDEHCQDWTVYPGEYEIT